MIWHHTGGPWVDNALSYAGARGVDFFFAISGFLITTLLLRERDHYGTITLKAFYWRRALRIFPLYYCVLALYVVLVYFFDRDSVAGRGFFNNLIYFITYTSNLFVQLDGRVIFYFAWSLATEEQFYLIWPPILVLCRRDRLAAGVIFLVLVICSVGKVLEYDFPHFVPISLLLGVLLAIGLHNVNSFPILDRLLGQYWSLPLYLMGLIIALTWSTVPEEVASVLFVAIVGACVIQSRHAFSDILRIKLVAEIGAVSYGMYLFHMLCKNAVTRLTTRLGVDDNGLLIFIFTLLLSILIASISFKYFELWFLEKRNQISRTHAK